MYWLTCCDVASYSNVLFSTVLHCLELCSIVPHRMILWFWSLLEVKSFLPIIWSGIPVIRGTKVEQKKKKKVVLIWSCSGRTEEAPQTQKKLRVWPDCDLALPRHVSFSRQSRQTSLTSPFILRGESDYRSAQQGNQLETFLWTWVDLNGKFCLMKIFCVMTSKLTFVIVFVLLGIVFLDQFSNYLGHFPRCFFFYNWLVTSLSSTSFFTSRWSTQLKQVLVLSAASTPAFLISFSDPSTRYV